MECPLTTSLHSVTVHLVRHARTAWNAERRFLGRTDVPLDDLGREQAAALALRFREVPLDAVYASPLARARETAAALGEPIVCPGLVEMDMGELEGLPGDEVLARYPEVLRLWRDDPLHVALPGGETLPGTAARVRAAFDRVVARHGPGATVAVVTHQIALATLICGLLDRPLGQFRTYMHRNTGFTTLRWGPPAELVTLDDAAHLDPLGGDVTTPAARR